tara:strand:+ start:77 stop:478 length:402 start_codon:yes stop_codon:yes gene_type:complete
MKINDVNNSYVKPSITQQDLISDDVELIQEKLKGYIQINPENYEDVENGLWIKYITYDGKYRCGGVLKINKSPNYYVLKNPKLNVSWCVDLNKHLFFVKDISHFRTKKMEMENLYKLYEAGLVKILEEPEQDD